MTEVSDENLVRALKGEKMIQNWRCRIGWHRWTTWTYEPRKINAINFDLEGSGAMFCTCADCNMQRVEWPKSKTIKRDK